MLDHLQAPSMDWAGATMSTLCAIHCAAMPVLVSSLPSLGLAWLGSGWAEWALVAASGLIALRAMGLGHRVHGELLPGALAMSGFAVVCGSLLFESMGGWSTAFRVAGGLLLVSGHARNALSWRRCRTAGLKLHPAECRHGSGTTPRDLGCA